MKIKLLSGQKDTPKDEKVFEIEVVQSTSIKKINIKSRKEYIEQLNVDMVEKNKRIAILQKELEILEGEQTIATKEIELMEKSLNK